MGRLRIDVLQRLDRCTLPCDNIQTLLGGRWKMAARGAVMSHSSKLYRDAQARSIGFRPTRTAPLDVER